jgi:hypothetical protein
MADALTANGTDSDARPAYYRAKYVSRVLDLALPTVYEIAREDPERLGAETFGRRCVRFRRRVIDELINGAR